MITLRTEFENVDRCRLIPNAKWYAQGKVWTYPATQRHAQFIVRSFPGLKQSASFSRLVGVVPVNRKAPTVYDVSMFLNTKPWGHQQAAYQFAMEQLLEGDGGAMMAMGMGTGKTLVTLMTMVGVEAKRVLITCPLRAVNVWKEQIEKHLNLPVNVLALDENEGSVSRRVKKAEEGWGAANGEVFIVIVNYQAAWRPAFKQWAYSKRWDMVVADESHKLKAHEGVASRCLADLGIGARYRLALTGTPMPHSPLDIFAQMRFVDESVFGSNYYRFRDKYAILGG